MIKIKIIFEFLNDDKKELCCPVCGCKDKFYHNKKKVIINDGNGNDYLDKFVCDCGWVMFYDSCSKELNHEVWDENHNGDTVISK